MGASLTEAHAAENGAAPSNTPRASPAAEAHQAADAHGPAPKRAAPARGNTATQMYGQIGFSGIAPFHRWRRRAGVPVTKRPRGICVARRCCASEIAACG
ncbi:hypothetical protein WI41_16575 [Burkholderia latens]|uniref:Uncharacterized protein n=1 Tax=Burkholderia latens TaxID=488446 RepID=A0AAP1C856_9BURK|nr:hypothetical protein WI41_16575 [Burkholderia latens]